MHSQHVQVFSPYITVYWNVPFPVLCGHIDGLTRLWSARVVKSPIIPVTIGTHAAMPALPAPIPPLNGTTPLNPSRLLCSGELIYSSWSKSTLFFPWGRLYAIGVLQLYVPRPESSHNRRGRY